MKYTKKFDKYDYYIVYAAGLNDTNTPNVSYCVQEGKIHYTPYLTPHDYVEIAGTKWATMNIGANSVTDYGLYFQWGDIQGYTADQVGSGEGKKYFGWADYKYGNGTTSPDTTDMAKYNSTDGKTVLLAEDDAVHAAWGGSWRMPTAAEFQALGNAVNITWTADYKSTGIAGTICTAKNGSGAELFFPAAGGCYNGSVNNVGNNGLYWSSSLFINDIQCAYDLAYNNGSVYWQNCFYRFSGYSVRGVLDK